MRWLSQVLGDTKNRGNGSQGNGCGKLEETGNTFCVYVKETRCLEDDEEEEKRMKERKKLKEKRNKDS
jgi:hypothetical protein